MRNINFKNYLLGGLFVLFGVMAITFASLSSNMYSAGLKNILGNSWKVYLTNIDNVRYDGNPEVIESPLIKGESTVVNYMVKLNPGESYSFEVDAKNIGTLDAKLKSFALSGLTEEQSMFIDYEVHGLSVNQILKAGSSKTVTVVVKYDTNVVNGMVLTEQTLDLSFILNFVQE